LIARARQLSFVVLISKNPIQFPANLANCVGRSLSGICKCQKSKHEHTKQHYIGEAPLVNAIFEHQTIILQQRAKNKDQNKDNHTDKFSKNKYAPY
jgi:aromatic ring-opening dioxygenase LigB subunit